MIHATRPGLFGFLLILGTAGLGPGACAGSAGGTARATAPPAAAPDGDDAAPEAAELEPLGPPPLFQATAKCDATRLASAATGLAPGESRDIVYDYTLQLQYADSQLTGVRIDEPDMADTVKSCIVEQFRAAFQPTGEVPDNGTVGIRVRFVATVQASKA